MRNPQKVPGRAPPNTGLSLAGHSVQLGLATTVIAGFDIASAQVG